MRVRSFHPFQPIQPEIYFADWIDSDDLWDYKENVFKLEKPLACRLGGARKNDPKHSGTTAGVNSSRTPKLEPLNDKVINDIVAATRATPAWQACEVETSSREGKYGGRK